MNIYTIKDDASQTCEGVYSFVNDAVAIRTLSMAAQGGQLGLVSKFPADFHIQREQIAPFRIRPENLDLRLRSVLRCRKAQ